MTPSRQCYTHSGNPGQAHLYLAIIAIPVAAMVGIAYGYLCVFVPFRIAKIFLPFGGGILLGFALKQAAEIAKCRNRGILLGYSIGCMCVMLYFAWAAFVAAVFQVSTLQIGGAPGLLSVVFSPLAIVRVVLAIGGAGYSQALSGATFTGPVVWLAWAFETVVLGAGIVGYPLQLLSNVFCEQCDCWCDEKRTLGRFAIPEQAELVEEIKAGDLARIASLSPNLRNASAYLRLDLQRCKNCKDTAAYQVFQVVSSVNKEGKLEENSKAISPKFLLSAEEVEQIEQVLRETKQSARK